MKHRLPSFFFFAALALAGCSTSEQIALHPVANTLPPMSGANYDISRVTVVPVAIFQKAPIYPFELRKHGVTGTAVVVFTVATDGSVHDVFPLTATDVRFGEAAVEAIRGWRFHPAQVDGRVVNCRMSVPIGFDLSE